MDAFAGFEDFGDFEDFEDFGLSFGFGFDVGFDEGGGFAGFGAGSVFLLFFLASFSGFSAIFLQKKSKIVVSKHMM